MSLVLPSGGPLTVTIPANESIAVYTQGRALVYQKSIVSSSFPSESVLLGTVINGQTIFGPYTTGATIELYNKTPLRVLYEVGTAPRVSQERLSTVTGFSAGALNATGTLTAELCLSGVVTSTTAAAVTATLDTGAQMELKGSYNVGDGFYWSAINTGGTNAFTVTAAASGHTLVGSGTVSANQAGSFLTVKTATDTFVTYRVAS